MLPSGLRMFSSSARRFPCAVQTRRSLRTVTAVGVERDYGFAHAGNRDSADVSRNATVSVSGIVRESPDWHAPGLFNADIRAAGSRHGVIIKDILRRRPFTCIACCFPVRLFNINTSRCSRKFSKILFALNRVLKNGNIEKENCCFSQ